MKIMLLSAALCTAMLSGCIVTPPPPPPVVSVETRPVYSPGYVVTSLPTGYRTVRYRRNVYYQHQNVYYRPYARGGYVVVTRPY
jgi:hypothetical protein